jgi:hypothetical protein
MRLPLPRKDPPARKTPLAAITQGLAAGLLGTAAFTGFQEATRRLRGEQPQDAPKTWGEAPEPAQVGKRVASGVFHREVPLEQAGMLTQVVHWLYGTTWGAVYALIEESVQKPLVSGAALTTSVMAADYTLLPLMRLYRPPWRYPAKTLGVDYATHLVHGYAVAAAYRGLDRVVAARDT